MKQYESIAEMLKNEVLDLPDPEKSGNEIERRIKQRYPNAKGGILFQDREADSPNYGRWIIFAWGGEGCDFEYPEQAEQAIVVRSNLMFAFAYSFKPSW